MKKNLWKLLIAVGVLPLVLPVVLGIYHTWIESWTLGAWFIMYSYIYWPTYVLGLVLIVAGMILRRKNVMRKNNGI